LAIVDQVASKFEFTSRDYSNDSGACGGSFTPMGMQPINKQVVVTAVTANSLFMICHHPYQVFIKPSSE